jgi:hypothetical protein
VHMTQHAVRNADELRVACVTAGEGDEILVWPGRYDRPALLRGKKHIVIRAADPSPDAWISGGQTPNPFWGGGTPATDSPGKPDIGDFALLIIDECEAITIEGLKIRDCWPTIISVKDTQFLTIRGCELRHATYAVFAKGKTTSHLLLEDNEWRQDDSESHGLWSTIGWRESHGGEGSTGLFRYYNGGFLSAKSIPGNVVVRRNRIMDAYNGIRMKALLTDPAGTNSNVHIFDNDFIRIRDNPTEPEVVAHNWHVRHNRLLDCHAWFSFDGVTGGFWYFYGNTGTFQSRQGSKNTFGHTMGRVLKLSFEQDPPTADTSRVPDHPWYVFNNSWHLRCPVIGGSNPTVPLGGEGPDFTAKLAFLNNAFVWCDPARYGSSVCEWINLLQNFDLTRCIDTRFDYSISDRWDFLASLQKSGHEAHGMVASHPIFSDAPAGDFTLAPDSGACRSGIIEKFTMVDGDTDSPRLHGDRTLNRGAQQDYGLTEMPKLEAQATRILDEIARRSGKV